MARDMVTPVLPLVHVYKVKLASDPQAFDGLAYYAGGAGSEDVSNETDWAGGLEELEQEIDYQPSAPARFLEVTGSPSWSVDIDGATDSEIETPIELISDDLNIPDRSVIQWSEIISINDQGEASTRKVLMYVLAKRTISRGAFSVPVYQLIPFDGDVSMLPDF